MQKQPSGGSLEARQGQRPCGHQGHHGDQKDKTARHGQRLSSWHTHDTIEPVFAHGHAGETVGLAVPFKPLQFDLDLHASLMVHASMRLLALAKRKKSFAYPLATARRHGSSASSDQEECSQQQVIVARRMYTFSVMNNHF